jgi:hypothetical protein
MPKSSEQRHLDDSGIKKLLGGMPLPEHATPVPDRQVLLSRAVTGSRRRARLLNGTKRRYLLVAAISAAVAVLAFASNYSSVPLTGWIQHRAWAAVDGFMLEYDRVYRVRSESDQESAINSSGVVVDTDLILARRVAEFLSKKYASRGKAVEGRPLLAFNSSKDRDLDWWRKRTYRFVALSDDPDLIAELTAYMRDNGAVSGPRKTPLQFYYRGTYSEPLNRSQRYFQPGRNIIVDGRKYRIPQDVDPRHLDRLQQEFESFGTNVTSSFRAYWLPGELYYSPRLPNPMDVGQLCTVELNENGDLVVTTLQRELDIEIPDELYEGLGQFMAIEGEVGHDTGTGADLNSVEQARAAGCRPTIIRYCPLNSTGTQALNSEDLDADRRVGEVDPINAIRTEIMYRVEQRRTAQEHPMVHQCYFRVFPENSWQQVLDGSWADSAVETGTSDATDYSQELAATARNIDREFVREHPECQLWSWRPPTEVDTLNVSGGPVLVIRAQIYTDSEELARQYQQALTGKLQLGEPLTRVIPDIVRRPDESETEPTAAGPTAAAGQAWLEPAGLGQLPGSPESNPPEERSPQRGRAVRAIAGVFAGRAVYLEPVTALELAYSSEVQCRVLPQREVKVGLVTTALAGEPVGEGAPASSC